MYAPTSARSDNEIEELYEDFFEAFHTTQKAHFNVFMEDFNAKAGVHISGESGAHDSGVRNHRGKMLVNFLEKEELLLMKSFCKERKWT